MSLNNFNDLNNNNDLNNDLKTDPQSTTKTRQAKTWKLALS